MYPQKANFPSAQARLDAGPADVDLPVARIEPGIPPFAESVLARLYGSFYASLPQLQIEAGTHGVQAYVETRQGVPCELWMFRLEGRAVRVLGEAIPIRSDSVERFARTVFEAHPDAHMLVFNAVYPQFGQLDLPFQRFVCSDDCVLTLPASSEAYLSRLGKATRKNMKRYLNRFGEAFPSFRYEVVEGEAVSADLVDAVVSLNRTRMAAKGKVSGVDAEEQARVLRLVRRCGLVGIGKIDGRVICGAIVYRSGANFFSFLRAHDPAYNDYRLGLVGAWHLVCACIERGGRELHFMWGKEPHKALLGGEQRELERVTVFRSRLHALRHADLLVKNLSSTRLRMLRQQVFEKARRDDGVGRLLAGALDAARSARRVLRK